MSAAENISNFYDDLKNKQLINNHTLLALSGQSSDISKYTYFESLLQKYPLGVFLETVSKNTDLSTETRQEGNVKYTALEFSDALVAYNKSIAFAPLQSKTLALALGNRAACLLNEGFIAEALVDVQRALLIPSIDADYADKLSKRRDVCLNRIIETKSGESIRNAPAVELNNKFFECAIERVDLAENDLSGRLLTANDTIRTGEIIIAEVPYACVLVSTCRYSHCCHCLQRVPALLECSQCSTAMYCSTECLRKNESLHKFECRVFEKLSTFHLSDMEFLAVRILIKAANNNSNLDDVMNCVVIDDSNEASYKSLDIRRIIHLVANTNKRSGADLMRRSLTAYIIIETLDKFSNFFKVNNISKSTAGGFTLRLLQNLPCNAHEVTELWGDILVETGAAVYATLSLLNHSCDPNVVRQSIGTVAVLRAIRPVAAGQELVDNYGYHFATHTRTERQEPLLGQYHFTCECEPCIQNWPRFHDQPTKPILRNKNDVQLINKLQKLSSEFEVYLDRVIQAKTAISTYQWLCEYLDFLDESFERPWQEYGKCQEAIKHLLNSNPSFNRS